jgi:predicted RNase H-like HicB family nuclease
MMSVDRYTYRISWAPEDGEHVATCAEFPSLSWLAADEIEALRGIKGLVAEVVADLHASGEVVPEPLAERRYSGRFQVRTTPDLHRRLAIEAAEAKVSLNRLVNLKLSAG